MIVIKAIKENDVIIPERILTEKEKETVTSMLCNGLEYIYYQNDEPKESE
jgi:hypothetical protein